MSIPGAKQGTEGFKIGNLRRELDTVPIANLDPSTPAGEGDKTVTLQLNGLSGSLKLGIQVSVDSGSNQITPLPAGAAVMQITPWNKFGDANKTWGRPVFQDPTSTTNTNAPLPQAVPFSWEGPFTMATGAQIDVTFNLSAWAGSKVPGAIVVQVVVEYDGHWWDEQAIQYVMSHVQLPAKTPISVGTQ